MLRHRQTTEDLVASLSRIEADWRDEHAEAVVHILTSIPDKSEYRHEDIEWVLDADFDAGMTVIRLLLDMPKDEFSLSLRATLGTRGAGITEYRRDRDSFVRALADLKVLEALQSISETPVSWREVLVERLKAGRGSAIKGQVRGRHLEDSTEEIVKRVFGEARYDARCRFVGASGTSTEKADFAIPSRDDPSVLIEVKAYGATGSKQTDVLGDLKRIVEEKRHDTHLLLVTDGITWQLRLKDLSRLVTMQNSGQIARIYTKSMAEELESDLRQLRQDHSL